MPKKTNLNPLADLTFEQAFAELEESVRTLERGDLPLGGIAGFVRARPGTGGVLRETAGRSRVEDHAN